MIRFEHSEYLYALILIPILVLLFFSMWQFRKRAIAKFGNTSVVQQLMRDYSPNMYRLKFIVLLAIVFLLVLGWANPQSGKSISTKLATRESVDVFIALDISYSMLAQDIAPSRIERAKRFTENLVQGLRGERIGLILFAGNAYLQMPLTTDYGAASLFTRSANPYQAPTPGTAIGDALELAMNTFDEESESDKVVIVITDGENHDEESLRKAQAASDQGIILFTIGVGTEQGGFIPTNVNGYQDFKRDETGNPVRTRLDESVLKELSESANGAYYNIGVDAEQIIEALRDKIEQMDRQEFEQRAYDEYASYFQYFVGFALLLMILEFLMTYRKSKLLEGKDLFGG
ncbi:MAG: VWA domain-containing protein [Bacteroidota bacterium]